MLWHYGLYDTDLTGDSPTPNSLEQSLDAFFGIVSVRHFFGSGWAASLMVPVGTISHNDSRVTGLGDLAISGQYNFGALWGLGGYRPSLTLEVGLSLPTGTRLLSGEVPTDVNPFSRDTSSVPPTMLGIGTRALTSTVRLEYTQILHRTLALRLPVSARLPLMANGDGLTFGPGASAALGLVYFPIPEISVSASYDFRYGTRAEEESHGAVLNSGGQWHAAELSIGGRVSKMLTIGLRGRVPVYSKVNGHQLTETFSLMTTLSYGFDSDAKTAAANQPPPGDVADLARGGKLFSVKTAPVLGKITVVDFWAPW